MSRKTRKSRRGRNARAKGHAFERFVANALKSIGYAEARRNLSQTRTARKEGPDVLGVPWFIECTNGTKTVPSKWRQAERDRATWTVTMPIVVIKRDRSEAVCWMEASVLGIDRAPSDLIVPCPLSSWLAILAARERAVVA